MDRGDGPHIGANHNAPNLVMPDLGDGPHIGPNHAGPVHNPQQEILQAIEHDERFDARMIHWLRFVLINGLVMEAIGFLRQIRDELEGNNIVNNFDNNYDDNEEQAEEDEDGQQVEDAPAEPRVDLEVNHPVEAEDPLPGGSRRNELPGAISDSDVDSDAEEEAPSTSSVPGGSRRRSREEDEGDEMSRKRFRCWNDAVSDSDTDSDTDDEEPVLAHSSSQLSGGTSKRRREEEDDDDSRGSKQPKRRHY